MRRLALASILFWQPVLAQSGAVDAEKGTVTVRVTEQVEAVADVATIRFAYESKSTTKDAAYQESVRAASKIIQALKDAKVPLDTLETTRLSLASRYDDMKKQELYQAEQSWSLRLATANVSAVVDLLVKSGANKISDIDWDVADSFELESKGAAAALKKARLLAERMAGAVGRKAGNVVEVSNSPDYGDLSGPLRGIPLQQTLAGMAEKAELHLFAPKIRRDVMVRAVFSLE